ncbi:MAG: CoA transferase [Chloroflexota bacterium]
MSQGQGMAEQALKGLKVLGFTWILTGPIITKFLADHGATVIKVESGTRPEMLRLSAPHKDGQPGVNRSGYFNFFNTNEYSVSLNLNLREGIAIARRLVAWADVVVENFRPGVLDKMGLGWEEVKRINPRAVMLSATVVGQEGPHAQQPGIGVQLVSYAGFTHVTGWPDREATQPFGAYTDFPAPTLAASVLMAALLRQRQTGRGQYLDLSQLETGISFLAPLVLDCTANGREGNRQGNTCSNACPHNVYACRGSDRWIAIAAFNDRDWQALRRLMGNPRWTEDPAFSTLLARKKSEDILDRLVTAWTVNFSAEEAMEKLQSAGIDAGVVQTSRDVYEDPQLRSRQAFWKMEHKEVGEVSHLGESFILSETPAQPRMPAPCLGEHTEHICREILGMSDKEFVGLMSKGVFD